MLKKIFVIVSFICLGACSTSEAVLDLSPKSSHTIYPSLKYMDTNATEAWLMGKWQLDSEKGSWNRFGEPLTEFSFDPLEGKWMKSTTIGTNKNGEYTIIAEGSFKLEENYWGSGFHYIQGSVFRTGVSGNYFYEELEKIGEDRLRVYSRGYDLSNPPSNFDPDDPNPKQAARSFGGLWYSDYVRIK